MWKDREKLLSAMAQKAWGQVAWLAGRFVRAEPDEKESVLAAMEFERWLAETCDMCLGRSHETMM
jgi:hypothetical protein